MVSLNGKSGLKQHNKEITNDKFSVDEIITGLLSDDKKIRCTCAELANIISEKKPGILYPHVDVFVKNLDSSIPKVRCFAACTLGNLASIDRTGKVVKQIKCIAQNLASENKKIQFCSVEALGKIARANPDEAERIFNLLISHKTYFPRERVVVLIENLEHFSDNQYLREDARSFLEYYAEKGPMAVRTKAVKILGKF